MKFVRKNDEPFGIHGIAIGDETITIRGREIYETDDKEIIEELKKDPEIVPIGGKKKKEKEK